jgi:putative lipoprotein
MSRSFRPALGLVPLILVFAGCAIANQSTPEPSKGLVDTAWVVTSISGQAVVPDAPPTMAFGADGRVSGTGGCNQYSGPYEIDGAGIQFGDLASTLMLCEGAPGTQETAFFAALDGANAWRIGDDGTLEIAGAGSIIAEPATEAPTPSA